MMSHNVFAVLMMAALGQFPASGAQYGGPQMQYGGGGGTPYGGGAVHTAPDSTHSFGSGDPQNQYDFTPNWAHGYYQEMPAYHGHHLFRPYNYKHVMPQSQTAAAWGIPPQMPISHSNFNAVNGVPLTYTQPAPARSGIDEMRAEFAKIDRQKSTRGTRRATATQVAKRSTTQGVVQTRHQQMPQSNRANELRHQIDKLNSELARETGRN